MPDGYPVDDLLPIVDSIMIEHGDIVGNDEYNEHIESESEKNWTEWQLKVIDIAKYMYQIERADLAKQILDVIGINAHSIEKLEQKEKQIRRNLSLKQIRESEDYQKRIKQSWIDKQVWIHEVLGVQIDDDTTVVKYYAYEKRALKKINPKAA